MNVKALCFNSDFTVLRCMFATLHKLDIVYIDPKRYIGSNISDYIRKYGSYSYLV
jgi:hypothetical protein